MPTGEMNFTVMCTLAYTFFFFCGISEGTQKKE